MQQIAHGLALGLGLAVLAGPSLAQGTDGDPGKWQPGMTAVFAGFLCNQPTDAAYGLVAALDLAEHSTIEEFQQIEEPLHCFFSSGPVKFLGRLPNSKVYVDPAKGRFVFVTFDIGGEVTAYGWIAEAFVSDLPYKAPNGGLFL